jgi:hypothetical protein
MKMGAIEMVIKEVDFKLLDYIQTADGNWFSIGFLDNDYQKTISKKTAYCMYENGQIIKKSEKIKGETVYENIISY